MRCYEIFLKLEQSGREVGRGYQQVKASDPFKAAVVAEEQSDVLYGGKVLAHAFKVNRIPAAQFAIPMAA